MVFAEWRCEDREQCFIAKHISSSNIGYHNNVLLRRQSLVFTISALATHETVPRYFMRQLEAFQM